MDSIVRPTEMAAPTLTAWMEKPRRHFGRGIAPRLKRQFLLLTAIATQGEIRQCRRPAATLGDDVVEAEPMWKKALRRMAILAPLAGTPGHARIEGPKIGFAPLGHLF